MGAAEAHEAKTALLDAIRDYAVVCGVPTDDNDSLLDAIQDDVMPVIMARVESAVPTAWSHSGFEEDESTDDAPGKFILTIVDPHGEDIATIVHRVCDGRFPLDGVIARSKVADADYIVKALNAYHE